ncbi:MAG: tetratricopeptide repeat protein [Sulfurimonas sp.]
MSFELNFEQLQQKLKKVLNPSRFRFVVILYPNTNMIEEIKEHISQTYPKSLVTNLDLKNKSYQDISNELYKNDEGFVYIDNFEEILNNPDLYNGFNQRRDKIASHNINLICFISLYKKEELFTKALNVIPDLWEFKNTVLELQKDEKSDSFMDIKVSESSSYSSIGGLTTKDKKIELEKLLERLDTSENSELKLNLLFQITAIYQDIGDYKQALEFQLQALKLREEILGEKHPDLATSYGRLSTIYHDMGELDKALEFQLKAIKIREKVLGEKHPDLAASYNNLSAIYQAMGELDKALELQLKAMKIADLGEKHPDLATGYNNLSMIYKAMRELDKALEFQLKAIKIREEVLEKKHPDLATSYNNISMIYQDMGELDKALELQLKAIILVEEVLGDRHPSLATSYNNISLIYQDMKECIKAKEFSIKSIKILERLDCHSANLVSVKNNLKFIETNIKKQKKAKYKDKGRFCKDV